MDDVSVRPYLVIPKLIEQPTWGGTYIAESKSWTARPELHGKRIGQSYELYDKSNLSLALSSKDPSFFGEISDNKEVERQSTIPNTVKLVDLIATNPNIILGEEIVQKYGAVMPLLLKFTQALGNSFQIHIKDGVEHPKWKPKPESWYYFEPGLITCGVKAGVDWNAYERAVTELDQKIREIAQKVADKLLSYDEAKSQARHLVEQYNPTQYVNVLRVEKGQLLDLSPCGIHHSWEEDLATIPLGNVLYEIQLNRMDSESTIRSFDKGKITPEGAVRPLQIPDYFALIDRSPEANDPKTHLREATILDQNNSYLYERILESKYYNQDRVTFKEEGSKATLPITTFRHIFVRSGNVTVTANGTSVEVSGGHSVFIPAGCTSYELTSGAKNTEVLISF